MACDWCDITKCPNWEWNREIVDSIILEQIKIKKMPYETMEDSLAIAKEVKKVLKDRETGISWCMLCMQVDKYIEQVKSDIISIT